MGKKMTRWGVGPKFVIVSAIIGIILILINYYLPAFVISSDQLVFKLGLLLIVLGVCVFLAAAIQVHIGFSDGRLVTGGVYALVRHPVYVAWILLIVPGLALATGLLLLLLLPFAMYGAFRALIGEEEEYLERRFGKAYVDYKNRVGRIFPCPWHRLKGQD